MHESVATNRSSEFGFLSDFGIRVSDFLFTGTPCPFALRSQSILFLSVSSLIVPYVAADAAFCAANEFKHHPRRSAQKIALRSSQSRTQIEAIAEKRVIKLLQFQPLGSSQARAAQPNGIQPTNAIVSARHGVRRQILADG